MRTRDNSTRKVRRQASCIPERWKSLEKGTGANYSAWGRAHLRKRSGYNGKFDYPLGRRKQTSERRGARTREIVGSLTMIRLRDDLKNVSSRTKKGYYDNDSWRIGQAIFFTNILCNYKDHDIIRYNNKT